MYNGDLSDAQWARLQPLLPPQKPRTGRPALPHRTLVNAILWVQKTGSPWRCLPRHYGSWSTAASRYHRWRKSGLWDRIARELELMGAYEPVLTVDDTLHAYARGTHPEALPQ